MSFDTHIGVIGQGFVGSAVAEGFRDVPNFIVETYDKFLSERSTTHLRGLVESSEFIFVCVPTPADAHTRACDTSVVESVIVDIIDVVSDLQDAGRKVVVVKSTIPPGTTEHLQMLATARNVDVDIVFNPEFLNARSAYADFVSQDHVIIGGEIEPCERVKRLFEALVPDALVMCVASRVAETVKYVKNCFFATKVSFFNEMYQICEKLDVSYDEMIELARLDARVGFEHTRVPGPSPGAGRCEGRTMMGFGGACLPKDILAFLVLARQLGVDPKVMSAAWQKNVEVRPERDWEDCQSAISMRS